MDILSEEYEIGEKLGQGQFGEVFKIVRKTDGCVFAMKQLKREPTAVEWPRDDMYFQREISILQRINHPHIVPYIDHISSNGISCLVLGYVEGRTL